MEFFGFEGGQGAAPIEVSWSAAHGEPLQLAARLLTQSSGNSLEQAMVSPWVRPTQEAFPGMERLPAGAQAALISLVFNRGPGMKGERRREMRSIRWLVAEYNEESRAGVLREMATQFQSMKRLWEGKGLPGMVQRREAEAALILSCF